MSRSLNHYICNKCGYNFQIIDNKNSDDYFCCKCGEQMIICICDGWYSDTCSCNIDVYNLLLLLLMLGIQVEVFMLYLYIQFKD
jgi:ribosomal protein L40E